MILASQGGHRRTGTEQTCEPRWSAQGIDQSKQAYLSRTGRIEWMRPGPLPETCSATSRRLEERDHGPKSQYSQIDFRPAWIGAY